MTDHERARWEQSPECQTEMATRDIMNGLTVLEKYPSSIRSRERADLVLSLMKLGRLIGKQRSRAS